MSKEQHSVTPLIEFRNVSVSFDREIILRNVNFSVHSGEKLAIIGPSGQGKSVLLKTIAGLIEVSEGEVLIEGQNWSSLRGADRDETLKKFGMLFQKNALFDSLTCAENIAFPLRETTDLADDEITTKVLHFLEAVGISHARELFPDEISGGMQKRLGIARALALNPALILYDDPTAGLDPITSRKIIELILQLQRANKSTVLAITNDMNRAFQLADRILMVVDKEVLITGSVEATKKHGDARVQQFIHGSLQGPLTELQ